MATARAPSRLATRATLIPPPPGSRLSPLQRNFRTGSTRSTEVETSTAGLGVRVRTMGMGAPPCLQNAWATGGFLEPRQVGRVRRLTRIKARGAPSVDRGLDRRRGAAFTQDDSHETSLRRSGAPLPRP